MKLINGYIFIDDKDNETELTNKEALLLECLNENYIATPKIIFEYVYKNDYYKYDESLNKTIRTLVSRLRKKLKGKLEIYTKNQRGYYLKNNNIEIINYKINRS